MSAKILNNKISDIETNQRISLQRTKSFSSSLRNIFKRTSKRHKINLISSIYTKPSNLTLNDNDSIQSICVDNTADETDYYTYRSKNVLGTFSPLKNSIEENIPSEKQLKDSKLSKFAVENPNQLITDTTDNQMVEDTQMRNPFEEQEFNIPSPPTHSRKNLLKRWYSTRSIKKSVCVDTSSDTDRPTIEIQNLDIDPNLTSLKNDPFDESRAFTADYLIKSGIVNRDDHDYSTLITELDRKTEYELSMNSKSSLNPLSEKNTSKLQLKKSLVSLRSIFSRPEEEPVLIKDPMPHFSFDLVNFNGSLKQPTYLNWQYYSKHKIILTPAYICLQRLYNMTGLTDTQMESVLFARNRRAERKKVNRLIQQVENKNIETPDSQEKSKHKEIEEDLVESITPKNYSTLWNVWFYDPKKDSSEVIFKVWCSRQLNSMYINAYEYVDLKTSFENSRVMMLKYGIHGKIEKDELIRNGSVLTFYIQSKQRYEVWKRILQILLEDKLMVIDIGQNILGLGWERNLNEDDILLLNMYVNCKEPDLKDIKILLCELVLLLSDSYRPCVSKCICYNMFNGNTQTVSIS